jgi:hypothetical protein
MITARVQMENDKDGGLDAWRPLDDIANMHFQPPLQNQLTPNSVIFLAYAPTEVINPDEQRQVDVLNQDFGPAVGIFVWDNRSFFYAAVHQLPCESLRTNIPDNPLGESAPPESPVQPERPRH